MSVDFPVVLFEITAQNMIVHVILLFLLVTTSSGLTEIIISDDEYKLLPPIFHIDPYEECLLEEKTFCRVSLKLTPLNSTHPSKIWKLIEETRKSKWHYNHDELYHAICTDNYYVNFTKSDDTDVTISRYYSRKYQHLGLEARVVNVNCNSVVYKPRIFDISFLIIVISYLLFVIFSTVYDVRTIKKKHRNEYIIIFSLRHNIIKLKNTYEEANFEKLKCIQGIRFYATLSILFAHTFCGFAGGYIANTKYLEDIPLHPLRHLIRNIMLFLVQNFFLISSWLLSYHTFNTFNQTNKINSFRFVWLTLWNRYFRLLPPLLFLVSINSTVWIYSIIQGPVKNVYADDEYRKCQENWWINLLFLNNIYKQHDMCYFISWYLAADTQLYALSLIILVILNKFKRFTKFIFACCIVSGITVSSAVTYFYNLDALYRLIPENAKYNVFLSSFSFFASYASTYPNMATYMLGLVFGYAYFKLQDKPPSTKYKFTALWCVFFAGLPLSVGIVTNYQYNRITTAILAGISKPIFALGIGIGIFGMAQQKNGFLQKCCEWKPIFYLGTISYSTYLAQFLIVFFRVITTTEPLYVSDYILFVSFMKDAVLSFLYGFVIYLLIELPAQQIQNILIPKYRNQIKRYENGKKE